VVENGKVIRQTNYWDNLKDALDIGYTLQAPAAMGGNKK